MMKSISLAALAAIAVGALAMGSTVADAKPKAGGACVTKYAKATAPTVSQAKWYALETTVQSVSWSLWPGYVATNKVEGYKVSDKYRCAPDGGQTTCHVAATFCK